MKKDNLPKMQLSDKVNEIPEALSIYINQLVYSLKREGNKITTLSLGEAFFDIPQFDFAKLQEKWGDNGYHYHESLGLPELRKKICEFYGKMYNAPIDYNKEILITAGSKPIIFMAMQAVLNEDDEVLIHEPAWLSYQEQTKVANGKPVFIPYDCKPQDFNTYFSQKSKILIINNPNNPAGFVYSKEELLSIYEQCREKGIYVLVDEAYSDFVIDDEFHSMASLVPDKDGIIVVNSLSKNMGLSGFRVGYVIATNDIISNILKLNQHLITCGATIVSHYLAEYFDDILEITLPQVRQVVEKRKTIGQYMDKIQLKRMPGESTFYFFANIEDFKKTSMDFCLYLLFKHGIATVPGSAYGDSTERFIRISIGTETLEDIYKALDIIKELIDVGDCDAGYIEEQLKMHNMSKFKK